MTKKNKHKTKPIKTPEELNMSRKILCGYDPSCCAEKKPIPLPKSGEL